MDFYTRFKVAHPTVDIGFISFHKLKPYFVRKLKDFNTCCCKYHQEMIEIKVGFNNLRAPTVHQQGLNSPCACACETICGNPIDGAGQGQGVSCQATYHTYKGCSDLWEKFLCPKVRGHEWFSLKCLTGTCVKCGVQLLPTCNRELDPENTTLVAWRRFQKVPAGKTKKGEDKVVTRLERIMSSPREFLIYAAPKIQKFIMHNFVAQWQDRQFKISKENLKEDEIMSLIDFSENYSFKSQNEVQEQHWYNFQLSILVHITYRVNPNYNPSDSKSLRLNTDYHYYISDDRKHDNLFVQHCLKLHWQHLTSLGCYPKRHVVWSDGCACQFKGARAWFFVSRYPNLTSCDQLPLGCAMQWNYWGSGHGKGPHDGAGACLKRALRKEQLKPYGARLQNATDVVDFLKSSMNKEHAAYAGARREVIRHFHDIKENDVDRQHSFNCRTVKGSRGLHSVRSMGHSNNVLLETRPLACFCDGCVEPKPGLFCVSTSHVPPWKLVTLQPCAADDAECDVELRTDVWGNPGDSNELASMLDVGDNFAVKAESDDEEGASFYIVQCFKTLHVVNKDEGPDPYGLKVDQGDEVVLGVYYKQSGRSPTSFVLQSEMGPCFIYSHWVIASKFPMVQAHHTQKGDKVVYALPQSALEEIESALEECGGSDDDEY